MRANVGVPPEILTDQHLIAEYRELLIPGGWQKKRQWDKGKSPIPSTFGLGKGHITFWRDKHLYLAKRHKAIVEEMRRRGFNARYTYWSLEEIPEDLKKDWEPSERDSRIIRERIYERIMDKPSWYRKNGKPLKSAVEYKKTLFSAPVYKV